MKKALVALLMVTSVNAFAGYTAEVCQTTESGAKISCRMVYFKRNLGEPSKYQDRVICEGENANTVCDKPGAHVPAVLSKINQWFLDHGFTAPADQGQNEHGGN